MDSFKVVPLQGGTFPPSRWPLHQHAVLVLIRCDQRNLLIDSSFQVIHSGESVTAQSLLEASKEPEIARGKVRGVRWVGEDSPFEVGEMLPCESCCMCRGVIHVNEHSSPDLPPGSSSVLEGDVESGEDLAENRSSDKFSVDESFGIKNDTSITLAVPIVRLGF